MSCSVLVVDDEVIVRDFIHRILEYKGYAVYGAGDGIEALEKICVHQPDIVILDIMMPRMDGLTFMRILREDPETANLPVIVLSAKDDDALIQDCLAAGAQEYLVKPISGRMLEQHIQKTFTCPLLPDQIRTDATAGLEH